MNKHWIIRPSRGLLLLGVLVLMLLMGTVTLAQPGVLRIAWWTVDSGGGTSSGGAFSLSGTTGQPDAGTHTSTDGVLRLESGFWISSAAGSSRVFIPLIQR
jgi:hypothetical protein